MKYTIDIKKRAEKFIIKLPKSEKERVLKAIYQLPEGEDIRQLKGKKNKGLLRLRVGDYRIIYSVDNGKLIVYVIDAGNRGEIYNRY
ncbi:MAG: type II toxin-antitoxin system RelE family toxin [Lachnospiraceae bacterium]|jgi:mRNA interferase RelE/StbE